MIYKLFAQIVDNEVKDIITGDYEKCQNETFTKYGVDSYCVEVTQYPIQIGDFYNRDEGKFYHLNIATNTLDQIEQIESTDEQIVNLSNKFDTITQELIEENARLLDTVYNLNMSLTELFEFILNVVGNDEVEVVDRLDNEFTIIDGGESSLEDNNESSSGEGPYEDENGNEYFINEEVNNNDSN